MQTTGGEGLVELHQVEIGRGDPGALQRLARRRHRTHAHDRRINPGDRRRDDPGERPQAQLAGAIRLDHQRRSGPVVDAGGVPRRHRSALAERGPEPAERLHRGVGPGMLVA
jgi:hypothetical protein